MAYPSIYADLSDLELVARYRADGDHAIVEELTERYNLHILGRCLNLTGSYADAEDLKQETLIGLLNWLKTDEPCAHFSALIYRIATNKSIDFMRRKARYSGILAELERENENNDANFVQNPDLVRLTLEQSAQEIKVRAKLRSLPEFQRRCIEAFYFDRQTYRQIAVSVSKPVNEVRNALQGAKRKLREMMTKTDE